MVALLFYPVKPIERGNAVGFGHSGIVKRGVDEVHQGIGLAFLRHNRLPNVDDFRCLRPETVNAQNFKGLAVKENFEHARESPRHLCPRDMAKVRVAHLIGDFLCGQFFFREPDGTDFGNGVNARGNVFDELLFAFAKDEVGGGKPALVVSRARQTGKPNHIADRIDVGLGRCLVRVVDENRAAFIGFNPDVFQSHVV